MAICMHSSIDKTGKKTCLVSIFFRITIFSWHIYHHFTKHIFIRIVDCRAVDSPDSCMQCYYDFDTRLDFCGLKIHIGFCYRQSGDFHIVFWLKCVRFMCHWMRHYISCGIWWSEPIRWNGSAFLSSKWHSAGMWWHAATQWPGVDLNCSESGSIPRLTITRFFLVLLNCSGQFVLILPAEVTGALSHPS